MKLLLDENLSHKLVPRLSAAFPDTAHVEGVGLHGQPDVGVWRYAAEHGFVIRIEGRRLSATQLPPRPSSQRHRQRLEAFAHDPDEALLTLSTSSQDPL